MKYTKEQRLDIVRRGFRSHSSASTPSEDASASSALTDYMDHAAMQ